MFDRLFRKQPPKGKPISTLSPESSIGTSENINPNFERPSFVHSERKPIVTTLRSTIDFSGTSIPSDVLAQLSAINIFIDTQEKQTPFTAIETVPNSKFVHDAFNQAVNIVNKRLLELGFPEPKYLAGPYLIEKNSGLNIADGKLDSIIAETDAPTRSIFVGQDPLPSGFIKGNLSDNIKIAAISSILAHEIGHALAKIKFTASEGITTVSQTGFITAQKNISSFKGCFFEEIAATVSQYNVVTDLGFQVKNVSLAPTEFFRDKSNPELTKKCFDLFQKLLPSLPENIKEELHNVESKLAIENGIVPDYGTFSLFPTEEGKIEVLEIGYGKIYFLLSSLINRCPTPASMSSLNQIRDNDENTFFETILLRGQLNGETKLVYDLIKEGFGSKIADLLSNIDCYSPDGGWATVFALALHSDNEELKNEILSSLIELRKEYFPDEFPKNNSLNFK
jgi:hypothetical protein